MKQIAVALMKAQAEFPKIEKNNTAKVRMKSGGEFEYKYADLPDVLSSIKETLKKHELAVAQPLTVVDGKPCLTTMLLHSSGEIISGQCPIPQKENPQEMGAVITYFRRYGLCSILGIAADEDVDSGDSKGKTTTEKKSAHKGRVANESKDPSSYVYQFGRDKGKTLSQMGAENVSKSIRFWVEKAQKDGKEPDGAVAEFIRIGKEFLKTPSLKNHAENLGPQ